MCYLVEALRWFCRVLCFLSEGVVSYLNNLFYKNFISVKNIVMCGTRDSRVQCGTRDSTGYK